MAILKKGGEAQVFGILSPTCFSSPEEQPGENISGSAPPHAHLSPVFNQSVHLKRISLFWDFNPVSELISGTQGLEEGDGRGVKATQLQPCSHNYTYKASRQPINHTLIMPLGKLIFRGSGLGHVGQIAGLVDFQAFFSQIKTGRETCKWWSNLCQAVFSNSRWVGRTIN